MGEKEIKKKLFIDLGLTVTEIARSIDEDRSHTSRVLSFDRPNERIRKKIEKRYRVRFDRKQRRAA